MAICTRLLSSVIGSNSEFNVVPLEDVNQRILVLGLRRPRAREVTPRALGRPVGREGHDPTRTDPGVVRDPTGPSPIL